MSNATVTATPPAPITPTDAAQAKALAPIQCQPLTARFPEGGNIVSVTVTPATAADLDTLAMGAAAAGLTGADVRREAAKAFRSGIARLMRGEPLRTPTPGRK